MHSLSKTPVSVETARQIIARHFGSASQLTSMEELKDGLFNSAYRLELADGQACVLKVAPHDSVQVMRYERDILRAEVEVLELVKAHTEIPAPAVLIYDTSRSLIDNDFFIMEFLPGIPLNKLEKDLAPAERAAIESRAGVYLRQMNAILGVDFGCVSWPSPRLASWREAFARMMADVLDDGQDLQVSLPLPYEVLRTRLAEFYPALDEISGPCLVHWDLWAGNIFIDPDTRRICGMIDFERALWGDPLSEVNFFDYGQNQAFMAGYGVEMLGTPAKRTRRNLYNIYLLLIMVIECYFRQYETNDQENWARQTLQQELDRLSGEIPE